jgi:hypothetical protein
MARQLAKSRALKRPLRHRVSTLRSRSQREQVNLLLQLQELPVMPVPLRRRPATRPA